MITAPEGTRRKVVIIGGVAGGMSAATRLRRLDARADIVIVERTGYVSYATCGLPYYLGGVIEDESSLLVQTPASLRARFALDVRTDTEAITIDRGAQTVTVKDFATGATSDLAYDWLILSPGATSVIPPLPGIDRAVAVRTVEDVQAIAAMLSARPESAVVIGGGFIGVEMVENLRHLNIATTLVEATPQLLAPLDPEMATAVAVEMTRHGVDLRLGTAVTSIGESTVTLSDGSVLPGELVVLAIGVRPESGLAANAGLELGARHGIRTDSLGRTSDPHILAIGDAAEGMDSVDGTATMVPLANIANRQGRRAADLIAGLPVRPVMIQGTAIVKVFDLTIAVTGWNEKRLIAAGRVRGDDFAVLHAHPGSHAGYYPGATPISIKLLMDARDGTILGAQAVGIDGVDKRIDVIATAMRAGLRAPELADLELAYAPPYGSAKDPVNLLGYMAENSLSGLTPTVQWNEVDALTQAGAVVLDVRTTAEYSVAHLPQSLNIPLDELRARLSQIPVGVPLVVNCQVGQRGHTATMFLRGLGFDARNLDGGYLTWRAGTAA